MPKPDRVLTPDEFEAEMKGFNFTRHIRFFQVHHTASPRRADWERVLDRHDGDGRQAGLDVATGIWAYHTKPKKYVIRNGKQVNIGGRGWKDGGMQTVTMPDGLIGLCRDWNTIPAGITGWNTYAFMTECVGDLRRGREYPMPAAQYESLVRQIAALQDRFDLPNDAVMFHKEGQATECPGDLEKGPLIQAIGEWRERDAESLDASDRESDASSGSRIITRELDPERSDTYTVVKGDTLWSIARAHEVSLDDLIAVNGIDDPGMISVGTELSIP